MAPEEKSERIPLPDVPEMPKEEMLQYEKEVLGVYLSGHPLEAYEKMWRRTISAAAIDFAAPETDEDGVTADSTLPNGSRQIIGGIIADKTIKYTKNNKVMAFITIEDLTGTVEVLVFPKVYEENAGLLNVDAKVFAEGRVSAEDERASKLLADRIRPFAAPRKNVWIAFPDKDAYLRDQTDLSALLAEAPGESTVTVFLRSTRQIKRLNASVLADGALLDRLKTRFGAENVIEKEA